MAWNPSPKVADCRDIARKWGNKPMVIILALDTGKGEISMATYGATKAQCAEAKRFGDAAYEAIEALVEEGGEEA